jgi:FdhD protein
MKYSATNDAVITANSRLIECRKLIAGHFSSAEVGVVVEKELLIYINRECLATAAITPNMENEFVTGYLFGQGFIDKIDDLKSLKIEDSIVRATVKNNRTLSKRARHTSYRIVSGGGRTAFVDEIDLPEIQFNIHVSRETVYRAMNYLFENAAIYRETEGVHAAGLFKDDASPICIAEDIGRHNTIDKVIGYILIQGIDTSRTFLVSTGRMSSEMVTKICRAGIPVVATKTAVTDKGLEIGQQCRMTIAGFVRDAGTKIHTDMDVRIIDKPGMKIYTHNDRIVWE